jgi:hypothetical protein
MQTCLSTNLHILCILPSFIYCFFLPLLLIFPSFLFIVELAVVVRVVLDSDAFMSFTSHVYRSTETAQWSYGRKQGFALNRFRVLRVLWDVNRRLLKSSTLFSRPLKNTSTMKYRRW